MRLRALLFAFASLIGAEAAIAQSDGLRRLTDRDDLLGWEAVGRLDTAEGGFCTATLIAANQVLTAAHCVYDNGRLRDASELTFRAGLRDGVAIAERTVAAIAVPDSYDPRDGMALENVANDVALLQLNQPITTADANPFVLHQGSVRGTRISVTSYGRGRAKAPSRQRDCRIVAESQPIMAFDCNVTFGSSGAPVFVMHGDRGRIVSVISGGGTVDGKKASFGMALPDIVASLKSDLRRQGVRPGTATIRRLGTGTGRTTSGAKFIRPSGS